MLAILLNSAHSAQKYMTHEFTILVSASPLNTQSHLTAMRFIEELLQQNLTIRSIFFYQDAVLVANKLSSPPSDEPQIRSLWQNLSESHDLELQTCVAASYRRGIIDKHEANERALEHFNLHDSFKMTGLGQLAAAMSSPQVKLVQFK